MKKYFLLIIALALASSLIAIGPVTDQPANVAEAQDEVEYTCAATHYPEFGACEADPGEMDVEYTIYNHRETDGVAIPAEFVQLTAESLEAETGVPFVFVNDWANVESGLDAIQVVNNVPVEGALYTILLPVGWTSDGSYTVVLSGNGAGTSNNARFYYTDERDGEFLMTNLVAESTADDGQGVIAALSNSGGTESMGIDEATYQSVGAFFDFIETEAGGDPERLVVAGISRGGGNGLMWTINPLGLDYDVKAVFADIPPTAYGTYTQLSVLNYPSIGFINVLVLDNLFGWSYLSNSGPGKEYARAMEYLISTGDPDEADAISPIGLAENLEGKDIVIGHGTRDSFFQFRVFVDFDNRLDELGIDHKTHITLGQGHTITWPLWDDAFAYILALANGEDYEIENGRNLWIDTTPAAASQNDVPLNQFLEDAGMEPLADGELPFTVEIPPFSGSELPMDISACGAVGADFSVSWTAPDSDESEEVLSGTFDESECMSIQIETPSETGEYTWSFTYQGETIDPTNTIARDENGCANLPAVTVVSGNQPNIVDTFVVDGSLNYGIDQFVGEADGCAVE